MNLDLLKDGNVLVIGDVVLDKYIHGNVSRVSPEAPVPVLKPQSEEVRLGGAANVASNVSSLGSKVFLQGVVGKDDNAKELKALAKYKKIKSSFVVSLSPTISKLRLLASKQQLIRIDSEEEFSEQDWKSTKINFNKNISSTKATALIISDYGKGTLKDIPYLIKEAKKKGVFVLVDPKGQDFSKYKGASIITPNYSEFVTAVGKVSSDSDLTKKAKKLLSDLNLQALLITRGSEGMTLIQKNKSGIKRDDFPTEAQDVFDVSGAGDTVIASLASAISSGFDLANSVKLANIAAGIVVGKSGTATPTLSELKNSFYSQGNLSKAEVKKLCQQSQKDSMKVVFTNGCFDVLHAGHVTYLQAAKKLGDKLIVGLNSDSSVKKLKGKERPINSLEERMTILKALECVDWVVPFTEETPLNLIKYLKPNVLVKGADYKTKDIVGSNFVLKNEGEVKTIPLVKGLSTTKKIQKIKNNSS